MIVSQYSFVCKLVALITITWCWNVGACPRAIADTFSFITAEGETVSVELPDGGDPPELPPGARRIDSEEETDEDDDDPKGEKKKADKKDKPPEPKVIRRQDSQDEHADPDELKASVGEDGKVAFAFRNQPWVDLVQWLAEISDQPLDWLELPGDRVNLRSPGRYTVAQTRDLFNRYLLARGYTLLEIDGGLTVAKTATINPAIVPRVSPEALSDLPPYTFVRTSLDVGWLSAEKLSKELLPMISSNGRLTSLSTTNRIEAMDAAVNLKQVVSLLTQERSTASRSALAPEFQLRYLSAKEAKRLLEEFLNIKKEADGPMSPEQIQMMMQAQQQNGGTPVAAKETKISIVANVRQNSILINATADRVAVAQEFLKRVDVPGVGMENLMDVKSRVQVFRLDSLDPKKLIEIVEEMNVLEPSTRVRVDSDNKALIVFGSMADRFVIQSLIERLDGSARQFEVMPLRRLDPIQVAETITFLMGHEKEKKDNSRRRYWWGNSQEEEKKDEDEFRVAANTRLKQILLWANEREMEQVRTLLVKLGELPPPGGNPQTVRILDSSPTPETLQYLKRLQKEWGRVSLNPLVLPGEDQFVDPNHRPPGMGDGTSPEDSDDVESDPSEKGPHEEGSKASMPKHRVSTHWSLVTTNNDSGEEDTSPDRPLPKITSSQEFDEQFGTGRKAAQPPRKKAKELHPIQIEIDAQGNLVLISQDTDALDRLENLMLQMKPPKRPYVVFHIEHASSSWMKLNLEDYYRDLNNSKDSEDSGFFNWYFNIDSSNDEQPSGLGVDSKMRFVSDLETNTLVVSGASPEQLRTIGELIELWDVLEPVNKRKTRYTKLVTVRYGKAGEIADTIKEAYRDLLSSNDKAFSEGGGDQDGSNERSRSVNKSRAGSGSELENSGSGQSGGGSDFRFKGKLSIGVDSIGNTLLVSAQGEPLLELVCEMMDQLDQSARPQGDVQVVKIPGSISSRSLKHALDVLGASKTNTSRTGNPGKSQPATTSEK